MNEPTNLVRREAPLPRAGGRPALVQGRYGSRGNLELVFPDAEDGLWVCWFNGDEPGGEPKQGALPGEWSGGLHFAKGRRYDEVDLLQARRGPDFLELVATTQQRIERWTWTPQAGFLSRGDLPGQAGASPAIAETASGLTVAAVDGPEVRAWTGAADAPPGEWAHREVLELHPRTQASRAYVDGQGRVGVLVAVGRRILYAHEHRTGDWHEVADLGDDVRVRGLAACTTAAGERVFVVATTDGLLIHNGRRALRRSTVEVADVCAAASVLEHERVEVVTRTGGGFEHRRARVLAVAGRIEDESHRPVVSRVLWPAAAPVHRR